MRLPCHTKVNWRNEAKTSKHIQKAPLCRGFVIFMKNNIKRCENEEVAAAVKTVESDTDTIFNWYNEFLEYHGEKK